MANPFDDDVDDTNFRNPAWKPKSSGAGGGYSTLNKTTPRDEEDELNFYERQIEAVMQDSLASTGRSLRALEESEQIGVSTAENLLTQGEKLRKTEKNLDHIQSTTAQTQQHLNNIKSIFGGVKNYFSKKGTTSKSAASPSPSTDDFKSTTKLTTTVTTLQTESVYKSGASSDYPPGSGGSLPASTRDAIAGTRWGVMDDEIDENLDLMASNLSRLKNLGIGLQEEIDEQNQLIDRIQVKADKTDIVVRGQDKQIQKILGVKKAAAKPDAAETKEKK